MKGLARSRKYKEREVNGKTKKGKKKKKKKEMREDRSSVRIAPYNIT